MKYKMIQVKARKGFQYEIKQNGKKYTILVDRNIYPKSRKVVIYDNEEKEIVMLKSKRVFVNACMKFPLIGGIVQAFMSTSKDYDIYENGILVGTIFKDLKESKHPIKLSMNGLEYNTYQREHGKTSFHIFRSGTQIGKVTKDSVESWNKRKFDGLFNSDVDVKIVLIMMGYIDIYKYLVDIPTELNYKKVSAKYELSLGSKAKETYDDDWKPTK